MAITYPAAYSSVQGDGGNGGLAITTDTTPDTDDILVVCMLANANGDTLTAPGGWTEATVGDNSIATTGGQIRAWYLADPADSTTYTWTVGTSTRRSIVGQLVRGVDNTSIIDVKGSLQNGPGANHTPPSLTTTVANAGVVDFIGLRQFAPDVAGFTVPASGLTFTERADVQGADSNNNCRLACGTAVAGAAGALSTATWASDDVNEDTIVIRIAFKPAAAGGTVTGTGAGALGALAGTAIGVPTVTAALVAALGGGTASASGIPTVIGTAARNFGALAGAAAATVTHPGVLAAPLGALAGSAAGTKTVAGTASATLGGVSAHGGVGVSGTGASSLSGLTAGARGSVAVVGQPDRGRGWYDLLDILNRNRQYAAEQDVIDRAPTYCPNDQVTLRTGPDGSLYCPFDGYRTSQ